ncbi:HAD family hydrolase [Streptomyces sp. ActVer]|uniref:HAD family hydrolase n=1 Tax=Streptomyces sp. ActVer TaxID=3014558 RepID=UPI0022B373A0|nr:HAD family hydrolase [Streptomyces sp. ActVer]MCZ4510177.1 HAD family hydrolase [Streptomyces sp. ActVer]
MSGRPSGPRALRQLLHGVDAVFFDFDGPLCDLFGQKPTAHIAEEIKVMARLEWGALDRDVEDCHDSHGILHRLRDMLDGTPAQRCREPLDEANTIVTRYEYEAVNSAVQAPDVEPLLDVLLDLRKRLVVVSNNAEDPVQQYLKRADLQSRFEAVCGRDPHEPRRMKPHPDAVRRALTAVGDMDPAKALLVGDQLTDLQAARAAGIRFLGYTQNKRRRRQMKRNGADGVVASHASVLVAARALVDDYSSERRLQTESK